MRSRRTVQLFSCTDAGNAELFVSRYGGRVRYDHQHGRWLIWDTCIKRWTADTEGKIRILAIETARYRLGIAARISDDTKRNLQANWALQSEDRHRLHAALDIARSLPPISDAGSAWDADPWLFGVANGVLDLRKGELREERPEDQITKRSTVQYDPAARCPQFERFLGEIFNADQALVSYTQRAIGYCLTGVINEQCFFSCYGFGANGKSTLFALLHTIFGDYAVNLPFNALEMKERNSHDLVALAGCRFATASETDEGVRLNEARIKALTGGDPITARRLYHEPFTFDPSHKLWLAFNYRPVILDNSEGMWRRVHLIPFTRQFKQTEQDKNLVNKLRDARYPRLGCSGLLTLAQGRIGDAIVSGRRHARLQS